MSALNQPQRQLSLFDITCLGINAIVGSSIFLFPGKLAGFLGPASILSFGLVGLLLINVALCNAEASTYFNRSGAAYLYASEAFGIHVGFCVGWLAWLAQIFSWAAVANGIALYLGFWDPRLAAPWMVKAVAAGVILAMSILNYRGVKLGARTANFFTIAKLLPLTLFILVGLTKLKLSNFTPFAPHGWAPLGPACFLVYFAYQGFEYIAVPGAEVERPQRNVPLALMGAIIFSGLFYMAIQAVAVGVAPGLAGSERPIADAAALILGPIGASIMVLGAIISTTGYTASAALVTPRYLLALAEDKHLPSGLAALHERFQTPYRAIILTTGITLGMAMLLDFNKLVDFTNVVVCSQYLAISACVPFLRRSRPSPVQRGFRLPGGWLIPILGCASTLWLGAQGDMEQVWWSLGLVGFGVILKLAFSNRGLSAA